jgi:hypothetical protein
MFSRPKHRRCSLIPAQGCALATLGKRISLIEYATPKGLRHCAIYQDLLARLNLSLVAQTLQGGESRHRHRSRLLEQHIGRLACQC